MEELRITHIILIGSKPKRRPFKLSIPASELDKLRYELMRDYDAEYCFFEYYNK